MLVGLAMLAAVGYGVSDFAGGLASRRVCPLTALLYSHPVGAVLVAALLPLFPGSFDVASVVFAVLAGLAGLLGFGLMYQLMATSPLNVVSPITAVLAAATPIACGVLSGEQPRTTAWLGMAFGLVAIALISGSSSGSAHARVRAKVLLLAFASGAGFGLYFVLLAHAGGSATGLWPLMIARVSSGLVIVAVAARPGVVATVDRRTGLLAGCAGLLDASADVCFLLATRHGYLSLVSVVTAMYPAITVLLAVFVLRERAGWLPRTGLALSAVSLALIAR